MRLQCTSRSLWRSPTAILMSDQIRKSRKHAVRKNILDDAKAGPATLDILVSYYTTDSEEVQSKTISITDAEIK